MNHCLYFRLLSIESNYGFYCEKIKMSFDTLKMCSNCKYKVVKYVINGKGLNDIIFDNS